MKLYDILADPAWQSIGAIVGGIGVFAGAWYGTYLANKAKEKSDADEQKETFEAYKKLLNAEAHRNKKILENMLKYLTLNPPIENAFDSVLTGANYLRHGTWDQLVASKVTHLLGLNQEIGYQIINHNVRGLQSTIAMEVAEWKRICEFHKFYKDNPPMELMQLGNLDVIMSQKTAKIEQEIKKVLMLVDKLCSFIKNNWFNDSEIFT